jgi:hypothetical protein
MQEGFERIYHHHVRKTAGTSLDSSFWALGGPELELLSKQEVHAATEQGEGGRRFVRHDPQLIARGDYFYASSHEPAHRLEIPPNTFTITILRDPAARVISYYRYLLWARQHPEEEEQEPFIAEVRAESAFMDGGMRYLRSQLSSSGVTVGSVARSVRQFGPRQLLKRIVPSRGAGGGAAAPTDFENFLRRVPPRRLLTQVHMFSAGMDPAEAAENVLACSEICFTESFSADLQRLAARLELPLEEKRERRFGADVELSDSELEQLRERLAPEYAMIERVKEGLGARR